MLSSIKFNKKFKPIKYVDGRTDETIGKKYRKYSKSYKGKKRKRRQIPKSFNDDLIYRQKILYDSLKQVVKQNYKPFFPPQPIFNMPIIQPYPQYIDHNNTTQSQTNELLKAQQSEINKIHAILKNQNIIKPDEPSDIAYMSSGNGSGSDDNISQSYMSNMDVSDIDENLDVEGVNIARKNLRKIIKKASPEPELPEFTPPRRGLNRGKRITGTPSSLNRPYLEALKRRVNDIPTRGNFYKLKEILSELNLSPEQASVLREDYHERSGEHLKKKVLAGIDLLLKKN